MPTASPCCRPETSPRAPGLSILIVTFTPYTAVQEPSRPQTGRSGKPKAGKSGMPAVASVWQGVIQQPLPSRLSKSSSPHSHRPITTAEPSGITASEPSVGRLRFPCSDRSSLSMPISKVASQLTSSLGSIPGEKDGGISRLQPLDFVRSKSGERHRSIAWPPSSNRLQPSRCGQYSLDKIPSLPHPMPNTVRCAVVVVVPQHGPTLQRWLARPNSLTQVDPGDPWL
jgi:hypothetical protein